MTWVHLDSGNDLALATRGAEARATSFKEAAAHKLPVSSRGGTPPAQPCRGLSPDMLQVRCLEYVPGHEQSWRYI